MKTFTSLLLLLVTFAGGVKCAFSQTTRTVTATVKDGFTALFTATASLADGKTVTASDFSFSTTITKYLTLTLTNSSAVVSSSNTSFTFTAELTNPPVELGEWYELTTRNADWRHMYATGAGDKVRGDYSLSSDVLPTYDAFNGILWKFVKDGAGVKLYNKRTRSYLKTNGTTSSSSATNAATLDANGTKFYLEEDEDDNHNKVIKFWTGSGTTYFGNHCSWVSTGTADHNQYMGVADAAADGGSKFTAVKADRDAAVAVGKTALTATLNAATANTSDGTKAIACTQESLAKGKADVSSQTSIAGLDAVWNRALFYPNIDAASFYRIRCVSQPDTKNAYITSNTVTVGTDGVLAAEATPTRAKATDALVPQLWQLVEQADGTFHVVNANTGRAMGNCTGIGEDNKVKMPQSLDDAANVTFMTVDAAFEWASNAAYTTTNDKQTMFEMFNNGHRINAFGGGDKSYMADYSGNHDRDAGNYWQLIKVTSVPVAIGTTGWTSVAFPFETTIPASSGVKAYRAGKIDDSGKLLLMSIDNGVIPAGEGVFLVNESGATTVNLDITSTNATLSGNALSGATAKRSGFTSSTTYLLALDKDGQTPALVKSELTWVPANKAYLNATALSTQSVLSFSFGTTDGIGQVDAAGKAAETYFDLNGRPVLYPQHGLFITNTGRKVYIK